MGKNLMNEELKRYYNALNDYYSQCANDESIQESIDIAGDCNMLYGIARVCRNDKKRMARMAQRIREQGYEVAEVTM